jgi:aspartate aminotransferase-like enzyme
VNATADNPYLLLTPGPLTTSTAVKESMLRDWCTWDDEYKELVQDIRRQLVLLTGDLDTFTSVLMQGSGTFSVESVLTSAIPRNGKLLVLVNGAYGRRMAEIARVAGMETLVLDSGELDRPDLDDLDLLLQEDHEGYRFDTFYQALKSRGFVIYPGKVTDRDTFRIGTIGNIDRQDINRLLEAVEQSIYWETSEQL